VITPPIILTERNENIDILRGFTMMYVIFIHCLYHAGLFTGHYSSIIKSLFLIEMPLFFFISGAGNSLGSKKGILKFYLSRYQRIIFPYWIYGMFCVLLTIIAQKILAFNQEKYFSLDIPLIFTPISNLPYLTWSLWFVPVYFFVILLFPFMKWYYERHDKDNKKYIPLLVLTVMLGNNGWEILYEAKMVIFYAFWMYAGLFFHKFDLSGSLKSKRKIIPVILFCAAVVLWFIEKNNGYADMQNNKFPPNIVFLVYAVGALLLFYLFSKYILNGIGYLRKNRIFDWIYKQYIQNCYSVFLYHPISFITLYTINRYTGLDHYMLENQWTSLLICLLFTIPVSAILGKLFSWGEKIKIIR